MNGAKRAGTNGFTLLEMLVVVGILGLLASLALPEIERGISRSEFRAVSATVELSVRNARARALSRGDTTQVVIETGGDDSWRQGSGPLRVPNRMHLQMPSKGLVFFGDGTSNGGTVLLSDQTLSFGMRVDRDTGAIRVLR